uniref:Integrase catalytic domain-containing protein n=1 Tax=Trichogramma kaykai TaxID=54128 RepID=A0ABD2W899_9HYME
MVAIDDTWQADLVEMIPYAKVNSGYKYLLTVIDVFSKNAWAIPVKTKTAEDVSRAMASILSSDKHPKNLHTDNGKEFYNSTFSQLMKKFKINHYSTFTHMKASICERFNRTLKEKMWRLFSLNGNYKWLDALPKLLNDYNNTVHRTIGMKPKDVKKSNEKELLLRYDAMSLPFTTQPKEKFKVGDKVRISKAKHVFEKGYTPNYTTEIFTISKVVKTQPVTYHLKDYQDQPISGAFYEQEISLANYPDVYLIEKIVKKKNDKIFVKWLGFDESHNSWINKDDYV